MRHPGRPQGEFRLAQSEGTSLGTHAAQAFTAQPMAFLGFDFGTRRIGVASGNSLTRSAQPLRTLATTGAVPFDAIGQLIGEWQPHALVVGVPFHPDGAAHAITERARRFARQLHGRFHLPVHEVDERYSTTEAQANGATDLDGASAAIILEQYLRGLE